jgi:hypothetical protein
VPESSDPTVVRAIAVTVDDVVTAVEARHNGRPAVLRLTPPFTGRMRARLHLDTTEYERTPEPVHVDPRDLLTEDAPDFPTPAETEDELRADPDVEYTPERHHDRHTAAVDRWREAVRDHVADEVVTDTPDGPHRVAVNTLG